MTMECKDGLDEAINIKKNETFPTLIILISDVQNQGSPGGPTQIKMGTYVIEI